MINQHTSEMTIFDSDELEKLRYFVTSTNPVAARHHVLESMLGLPEDHEDTPDEHVGSKAAQIGSLAGFVIARYGRVKDDYHTFRPSEVEMLRRWFERGGDHLRKDPEVLG